MFSIYHRPTQYGRLSRSPDTIHTCVQSDCCPTLCLLRISPSNDSSNAPEVAGLVNCRVTPKGCASVEGGTATKAWSALFTSQDSARALGFSGAKQFGLQHPRVQRLLQSLPGAAGCERYAAWLGPPPPVPTLVSLHCIHVTLSHYLITVSGISSCNALVSIHATIMLRPACCTPHVTQLQTCAAQQAQRCQGMNLSLCSHCVCAAQRNELCACSTTAEAYKAILTLQTAEEHRDRQAFSASMQQLPAGVQGQKGTHPPAGVCHVCFVEDYTDDNLLIEV